MMDELAINYGSPINWSAGQNQGLAAWWLGLPNWSGGGTFHDLRGRYHGTLNNGAFWRPGRQESAIYRAIELDGTDDHVSLPTTISGFGGTTAWTVAFTQYSNSAVIQGNASPFGDDLTVFGYPTIRLSAGTTWQIYAGDGGSFFVNAATITIPHDSWQRVLITYDGSTTLRAFVNGAKSTAAVTGGATLATSANALRIGGGASGSSAAFAGYVGDVRLWGRSLTDSDAIADWLESLTGYPLSIGRVTPLITAKTTAATFTATAAVTVSTATASGSATHTAPTFSATAAVSASAATAAGVAAFTPPTFCGHRRSQRIGGDGCWLSDIYGAGLFRYGSGHGGDRHGQRRCDVYQRISSDRSSQYGCGNSQRYRDIYGSHSSSGSRIGIFYANHNGLDARCNRLDTRCERT